jgi:hypothetical protein
MPRGPRPDHNQLGVAVGRDLGEHRGRLAEPRLALEAGRGDVG